MIKKILKILFYGIATLIGILILVLVILNIPVKVPQKNFELGVTFSSRYAQDIGLDWRENYLAVLDDLKITNVRIPAYWDLIEKEEGVYDFSDLDWQLAEAEKRGTKIILVVGQKVPRWPECFVPDWAKNDDAKRREALKKTITKIVERYKDNPVIYRWQVENEPFLSFGICPVFDSNLLDEEIAIVKNIDPKRPIVITDSGELSLWVPAAKRADIFGTTMYFTVYSEKFGHYLHYPIGPNFFKFKGWLVKKFADQENIIIVELQGEPWLNEWTINANLEKQLESMNSEKLRENIEFAKKTGFNEIYVWGVEWWYWLKVKKDYPNVWNDAREIFSLPCHNLSRDN